MVLMIYALALNEKIHDFLVWTLNAYSVLLESGNKVFTFHIQRLKSIKQAQLSLVKLRGAYQGHLNFHNCKEYFHACNVMLGPNYRASFCISTGV